LEGHRNRRCKAYRSTAPPELSLILEGEQHDFFSPMPNLFIWQQQPSESEWSFLFPWELDLFDSLESLSNDRHLVFGSPFSDSSFELQFCPPPQPTKTNRKISTGSKPTVWIRPLFGIRPSADYIQNIEFPVH
jgi:hypothetical protein